MIQKIFLIIKESISGLPVSIVVFIVMAAAFSIGSIAAIVKSVESSILQKFESAIPPGHDKSHAGG